MSGIYIHIPFCKQACYYCDFHFSTSLKRKKEMIEALVKELEMRKEELPNKIETIYFGGGTPSLLTIFDLEFLTDAVYKNYNVVDNPEITLEANPDDLTSEKIKLLAATKINRLSIGIQSFFDDDLEFMNRAHNSKESENCIVEAKKYFKNITIDLIYGIPNMSSKKWKENLQKAFRLGVPHISAYALTVENKTALDSFIKKGKYPPINENLSQQHFQILVNETFKNDFVQYEISNFGKEGYFSKHNTSYWQGKHYLGIGPSAHSYNGNSRSWNVSNNAKYIKFIQQNISSQEIEYLSVNNHFNETIMTGLRTIWGVSLDKIEKDFGIEFKENLLQNATKYFQNRTLKLENNKLKITDKGKFFSDGIASDLFMV